MRKLIMLLFLGTLAMTSACKKDENKNNSTTNGQNTTSKTMLVYIGEVPLNNYFGGNPPMIRVTEDGTSNQVTVTVNSCGSVNGSTLTIKNGKTYNVVFGTYIDGTWAPQAGFSGTMSVASDGQVSGVIGTGIDAVLASKTANYTGCGTTITDEIILFY